MCRSRWPHTPPTATSESTPSDSPTSHDWNRQLHDAGFERLNQDQAGLWFRTEDVGGKPIAVELDLLIGATLAQGGRRSVTLPPHDKMSVRRVPGLETAVVDRDQMTITALEDTDHRSVTVHVAGPAALLVAKAHKLHDRFAGSTSKPDRLVAKDAADVYRLMVGTRPADVQSRLEELLANDRVGEATRTGLKLLREQFGGRDAPGVRLATTALAGAVPETSCRTHGSDGSGLVWVSPASGYYELSSPTSIRSVASGRSKPGWQASRWAPHRGTSGRHPVPRRAL